MTWPNKYNKIATEDQKTEKCHQLCFELRQRWEGYMVKVISTIIGCLGGGIKELKEHRQLF